MSRKTPGAAPDLYEYTDYRPFLKEWMRAVPPKSRGQMARMSEAAAIHKTTLSQVFAGVKDLSLEQAVLVARHVGLARAETEYFLLLVERARAGSELLRQAFDAQIEARRRSRRELASRVTRTRELGAEERAIFYSSWIYAAIRNLSALPEHGTPSAIARRLRLDPGLVERATEFLVGSGLCVESGGRLEPGPRMTHLEAASPFVARHHGNWRVKAMERHPQLRPDDELAYTAPMTLSAADAAKVRALIADLVEKTDRIVGPSRSERLYCLCVDWFEIS